MSVYKQGEEVWVRGVISSIDIADSDVRCVSIPDEYPDHEGSWHNVYPRTKDVRRAKDFIPEGCTTQ